MCAHLFNGPYVTSDMDPVAASPRPGDFKRGRGYITYSPGLKLRHRSSYRLTPKTDTILVSVVV